MHAFRNMKPPDTMERISEMNAMNGTLEKCTGV